MLKVGGSSVQLVRMAGGAYVFLCEVVPVAPNKSQLASEPVYDELIIGAGMAGLTVGALLAQQGRKVLILEAHDQPGGYAHTFAMGKYRFCAQVHYIFGCGEGGSVQRFLERLGLTDQVRFNRLDPDGFDHVVVGGERFRIPNGFPKFRDRMIQRFPDAERPLRAYFDCVIGVADELERLPLELSFADMLTAAFRFPKLLRYRSWTLQRFYDHVQMPKLLQAVLAGQSGDYLLPPEQVSLLLHVSLIDNYGRGAYYPQKHFCHLIDSVVQKIREQPGCAVVLEQEVRRIVVDEQRVVGVETADGQRFRARRYISNVDPAATMRLVEGADWSSRERRRLDYTYSCSTYTLYLGVKDLDLREHGFGSFNVWHYPHDDINRMYRAQLEQHDLSDPWLFLATPTLHTDQPGIAPPGQQILEVATSCDYMHFKRLRDQDRAAYTREKLKVRDRILEVLEAKYVPGLRKHLAMRVAGTPLTNEQYCRAPLGNAYGTALTPAQLSRIDFETPIPNLYLVNASAGYPSIGGTVGSGMRLFDRLIADADPGR
jgi:all-trans-retinol 13,14-reductase